MDVLTLRGVLTLDKSQYDRGLDEANSKAGKFGSSFKSGVSKAAKAGAVALGAFAVSSAKTGETHIPTKKDAKINLFIDTPNQFLKYPLY